MKTVPRCYGSRLSHVSTIDISGAALLVLYFLLAGCSPDQQQSPPQTAGQHEKVTIKGSNTVGEELAPRLIAEYKREHPNAAFELETKGSASGFWGLIAGVTDIAASSRSMIED